MIRTLAFGTVALLSTLALATPKDDITAAADKLADADSYTWISHAESGGFPLMGGPTTGKTQKLAYTTISLSHNSGICIVYKAAKCVLRTPTGWLTPEEVNKLPEAQRNYNRALTMTVESFKHPPAQVLDLLSKSAKVQKTADGAYTADLTEAAARAFIAPGAESRKNPAKVLAPKGSATFWIKDGLITKFQYQVSAKLKTEKDERDYDRLYITTIKDVNSTTLEVPPEADRKLE